MLAQAAQQAGYIPLVIDLYADSDTQSLATHCCRVPCLGLQYIEATITTLKTCYPIKYAIYGSGLECHPDTLQYLANQFTVWGNPPNVFRTVTDKPHFFSILRQLGITYPITYFAPPPTQSHWLLKPLYGQGGQGIQCYAANHAIPPNRYWQQYIAGIACSVLFLADGQQAVLLGFNQQWANNPAQGDFSFAGIINRADLRHRHQQCLANWVQQLTPAFKLQGLNSLDVIVNHTGCYALEINARPPASMQLYDNLLPAHIAACQGQLPAQPIVTINRITAYQIVYATQSCHIPSDIDWPIECVDLPAAGALIGTGQPICSMMATANTVGQVKRQLRLTQHRLFHQLQGRSHGI
jgi:uncharacterized protein